MAIFEVNKTVMHTQKVPLELPYCGMSEDTIKTKYVMIAPIPTQLNRGVEQRPDKRPMLSDLRESGAIEQDADIVSFLYRPEYYGIYQDADGNDTAGMTEYIIAKGRSIGTGTIKLMFKKETTKFEE